MTVLRQLPLSTVDVLSTPCIFPLCVLPPLSFFLFYFHLMKLPQKDIILRSSSCPNLANKFANHIFLEKWVCSNYLLGNQETFAVFFCRSLRIAALWTNRYCRYLLCLAATNPRSTCQKHWISENRMHKRFPALLVYFFFNIETRKNFLRYPMVKIS